MLERYYKDADRVLILSIDADRLSSKIVAEPSTDDEVYPHVYGEINTDAVIEVAERTISV